MKRKKILLNHNILAMALTEKKDYLIYDNALMMNSKQPMQQIYVCVVATEEYIFYVPKKTIGLFVLLNTIKTHQLFEGVSIEEGVKRLISKAKTVGDLEKLMIALLEEDEKYIHKIVDYKSFKFGGMFGHHSLRMSNGRMKWTSVGPVTKKESEEFREFYKK